MSLGTILVAIICTLILTLPVMWLWNWLMPIIFGLPEITFLQTLGLTILSSFLFKPTTKIKNDN